MARKLITAKEAAGRVAAEVRNERMQAPSTIPSVKKLILDKTIHVFNVGPWAKTQYMGSLGRFFIPANTIGMPCSWEYDANTEQWAEYDFIEEGQDISETYAAMRPYPGISREPLKVDESKRMRWSDEEEGTYVVDQILCIGIGHSPANALTRFGIFRALGSIPTKAELDNARATLRNTMLEYVKEARSLYANPKTADQIQVETHHVAARWLNLEDEEWMVKRNPEERVKCKGCGALVDKGVATCPNGHIIDFALYQEFIAEQEAMKKAAQ